MNFTAHNGLRASGRDSILDSLRGFAIIFVVIGHIPGWLNTVGVSSVYGNFIRTWVYYFHMPLFFMLSGYVHGMKPPLSGKRDFVINFKKNILDLYVPCMFFSLLQAFINLFILSSSNSMGAHVPSLGNFLRMPLVGFLNYWFLSILFFAKSLHLLGECYIKREYLHSALWIILFILTECFGSIIPSSISRMQRIFTYGIFFHLGYIIKRHGYISSEKNPGIFCGIVLLFAGVICSVLSANSFTETGVALFTSLSLLIIFYALKINVNFLATCGIYSMVIYCIHNYVAALLRLTYKYYRAIVPGQYAVLFLMFLSVALLIPLFVVWLYKNVKYLHWIEYLFYPRKLIMKK